MEDQDIQQQERDETPGERARRLGPPTFDHLKKKQRRSTTVSIPLDDDLAERYQQANLELERARLRSRNGDGPDPALVERYERLRAEMEESTIVLKVEACGRHRYEEIVRAHPPTPEQQEDIKALQGEDAKIEFNPETLAPVLISECLVEPRLTEEQARELLEDWNDAEVTALLLACIQVNTQRRVVELGER